MENRIMLRAPTNQFAVLSQLETRESIPIEKGVELSETDMERNEKLLRRYFQYWSAYPDAFIDFITPPDSNFRLFPYQRIFLRACMRFKEVYGTAARAFSKSFICVLAMVLQCIFIPGHKAFICAPNKSQGARIAKEKLYEIFERFPLLRREVTNGQDRDRPGVYGPDYVTLIFRNGSQFDVVGALESTLGGRRHSGLLDEIKIHDEEMVNTVVLPLLNVSRRLPNGEVNPKEPNQQIICMTSAWLKSSFAYDKLIDIFMDSIIFPDKAFCFGCDYRIPMMHGLISEDYVNQLKMSPSFNSETFAREYLSMWSGGSDDSWYNYDRISRYRVIKNPETRARNEGDFNQFYLLSVDVGRITDSSVVCVHRINVRDNVYYDTLTNIFVLGTTPDRKDFYNQAIELKRIIESFNPREVVVDTNGLGVGFGDELTLTQIDSNGIVYPAYGFFNDDNYKKTQPNDAIPILYSFKASSSLKSKVHSTMYSRISAGKVRFLIKEQEAKTELLSTKVGQKMGIEERVKRLRPHELTTELFDQIGNFKLKQTGSTTDIILEPINTRMHDDIYMSFGYGLYRIKEIEEENFKRNKRRGNARRKLFFYN